ncbi:hypothetical protein [Sphingopyxis sp.]|uniref:hypothetical protein n=1 Tax=Sphingopyxis sp. TaxID=1908224 RepID=UPI003F711D99
MIAAVILTAMQTAAPPPPVTEEEILVVAGKMRSIEVDIKAPKRSGIVTLERCRVTKPSGYAELDAIPCGVAQQCVAEKLTSRKALTACVEQRSNDRLDAVLTAWRAASGVAR